MSTPAGTTERRRALFFFGAWAYFAVTVMLRATGSTNGVYAVLTAPGTVYQGVRNLLQQFAYSTAVAPAVVQTLYVSFAVILLTVSLYLLDTFVFPDTEYVRFDDEVGKPYSFPKSITLWYVVIAAFAIPVGMLVLILLGESVIPAFTAFLLTVSPQVVSLLAIAILISGITAYVPPVEE